MGKRKKTQFGESLLLNMATYEDYLNMLLNIAVSRFEWTGLPESCDAGMLERVLFTDGTAIFCRDDVIGWLTLPYVTNGGHMDVYGRWEKRRAYSRYNNYSLDCNAEDSVIIFNNILRTPASPMCEMYARRLYEIDRTIDVNIKAQKTPVLLQGSEKQRLTLLNLYEQYDGNQPFIFGDKNMDFGESVKVVSTGAPYIAGELYELKAKIWNEALTYLGVPNIGYTKKERMITDEVQRAQGGAFANRYSYLESREKACRELKEKFGLDVKVTYREFSDEEDEEREEGGDE